MQTLRSILTCAALLGASTTAFAAGAGPISVNVEGIAADKKIDPSYARCKPSTDGKSVDGDNLRPTIRWSNLPKETKSIAVFMMDPDVPADFSDAGKEGKTIAADAKRQDFFHYGVINIPATATQLNSGHADNAPVGTELVNDMGLNQYVSPATIFGGPCPPWNDARVHHYHFIVLALDADAPLTIAPRDTTADASKPAEAPNTAKNTFNRLMASKHILAKGTAIGTYTLNPTLRK